METKVLIGMVDDLVLRTLVDRLETINIAKLRYLWRLCILI